MDPWITIHEVYPIYAEMRTRLLSAWPAHNPLMQKIRVPTETHDHLYSHASIWHLSDVSARTLLY